MRLGTVELLRETLGGRDAHGKLVTGLMYARELKRAAVGKGNRLFDIDAVLKWREEHPEWKSRIPGRKTPLGAYRRQP